MLDNQAAVCIIHYFFTAPYCSLAVRLQKWLNYIFYAARWSTGSNVTVCTVHGIIGTIMQSIKKNFGVHISKHVLEIQGEGNHVKGSYTFKPRL